MSGGGGGIIIIDDVVNTLQKPIVHGALPQPIKDKIDPILAKHMRGEVLDDEDKLILGDALRWAVINLK